MNMDSFLQANLREVEQLIDQADVMVVGFPLFLERLLVDVRSTPVDQPLVRVVPPVARVEERIAELRALRPRFGDPERFSFFVWPKRVATMQSLGLWKRIVARVATSQHPEAGDQCEAAFRELSLLEHRELVRALTGEGYRSLWQRPQA